MQAAPHAAHQPGACIQRECSHDTLQPSCDCLASCSQSGITSALLVYNRQHGHFTQLSLLDSLPVKVSLTASSAQGSFDAMLTSASRCAQLHVSRCQRLQQNTYALRTSTYILCTMVQVDMHQAVKDNRRLQYTDCLDMRKYSTHGALSDGWGSVYRLGRIGLHTGGSAAGGHYQLLQKVGADWLLRDDANVPLRVSHQEAMSQRHGTCVLVYFRTPPDRYV